MRLSFGLFFLLYLCIFNLPFTTAEGTGIINIWNANECSQEINKFCKDEKQKSNSDILNCLESSQEILKSLSIKCHNFLWNFKNKYLNVDYFNTVTKGECQNDLARYKKCKQFGSEGGVLCLIKHKSEVTNLRCSKHLKEVATILFSDVLVINKFISSCSDNVKRFKCGRLQANASEFSDENFISRSSSQGTTIECLIGSLKDVTESCRKQILRLGELQSDDFHLNPKLYFSCRHERDVICDTVESGKSRVYRCLESHKFDSRMSHECRGALRLKHKLEFYDYKIRAQFSDKCAKDISSHQCATREDDSEIVDLFSVISCLLDTFNQSSLSPACQAEVSSARVQLSQNNEILAYVVKECSLELKKYCATLEKGDTKLSCLFRHSLPVLQNVYSQNCIHSLQNYIKILSPVENAVELDPMIGQSCSQELSKFCNSGSFKEPGDRYNCLLGLLDEDKSVSQVTEHCKTNLLTLAQFMNSEHSLNEKFARRCARDAKKHCKVNFKIHQKSKISMQAALHCLIRRWSDQYIRKQKFDISGFCVQEIRTVIQLQASNVLLNFDIYNSCSMDLEKHCRVQHKMDCLQLNYQKLSTHCKNSISNFLSLDAEEYSLKKLIARSCRPMIKQFCTEEGKTKRKEFMECLLRNKFNKDMDKNCRIALEHYQIVELDNYKISHKFARFCSNEIKQFCGHLMPKSKHKDKTKEVDNKAENNTHLSKSQVVICLSKKLTIDLLKNQNPFSAQCYEQFTFEFLQQTGSVNVDPELKVMCTEDIDKWCPKIDQDEVLTCLHRHQDNLQEKCSGLLFSRQQLSALDSRFDVGIQRYCHIMIKTYCEKTPSHQVFRCLHEHMRIEGFDPACKERVKRRLERRLVDLRLNPELMDDCGSEIKGICNFSKSKARVSEMEFKDKHDIINCLRTVYVEHKKFLGGKCRRLVFDIILDANSDIHLDPGLYSACQGDIKQRCSLILVQNTSLAGGLVQDCLKHTLLEGNLHNEPCFKEVYRLLREGRADIHVDPQLYSACKNEIQQICHSELLGYGRKLSCLLWAMENKRTINLMSPGCKMVLQERKEMWEFAARIEVPVNLNQMFQLVSESDSRYYFYSVFFLAFGLVLIIGIFCGRRMAAATRKPTNRLHN